MPTLYLTSLTERSERNNNFIVITIIYHVANKRTKYIYGAVAQTIPLYLLAEGQSANECDPAIAQY